MTDLAEFHRSQLADARIEADSRGILTIEAWFDRVKERLSEAGEVETADIAYFEQGNGAQRLRVDGYGGDPRDCDGILSLIICDFHDDDELKTIGKADLPRLFNPLIRFMKQARDEDFRNSLNEVSPGFQVSDLLITTWKYVEKIKLILLSNRHYVGRVDGMSAGNNDGVPVTYNVWDLARIERHERASAGREEIDIDLDGDFGGGIPALRASRTGGNLESYLMIIPGAQLAAIYDRWGARLLEANVRSFLQARAATNKGIAKTIRETPEFFFPYNNGLSATASEVETRPGPDGLEVVRLRDLQIVNGGQTTGSIHAALRNAKEQLESAFVQMKLTIVPPEEAEQIVPNISKFANTQNKVNAADFFSNHPFHIRMEQFSRQLLAPKGEGRLETRWFYERTRGQYLDEKARRTPAQQKKFELEFPKSQLFTKTDLAKYEMSSQEQPHVVSTGAQKNFSSFAKTIGEAWEKGDAKFDETWFRRLVGKAIIFRDLEREVPKQPWYPGGYRANIVTYAIAKVFHDARAMGKLVDLDAVWRQQTVPGELKSALLSAAAEATLVITSPPEGVRNITEWAKKQACWANLQKVEISYEDLEGAVQTKAEARETVKEARADRSVTDAATALIEVTNFGAAHWASLLEWARSQRKLTPKEAQTLGVCASMPRQIPSDWQAKQALDVLQRMSGEGYQPEGTT
ncbi:AIPR family protein [Leisingera thetidis]|uniref:AIPR family protein n=1 Tax=Leisingera thetidis TaxID=2930199 RepID=UPI0021F7968F|nr:AIPR family protein [Leisingera thetidis]